MKSIKIPTELKKMYQIFSKAGFEAWLVGGAVRDIVCGKKASDWDIATNAQPKDVIRIFHKVIPTGIEHGTVTVIFMGLHIEVTTFRTETAYKDGRHPESVLYAGTIEEDLSRRDFTMNAIAASLVDGHLCDPFRGQEDIKKGIIRTVGEPLERFRDEFIKILSSKKPSIALKLMEQSGMLKQFLPELAVCRDVIQSDARGIHCFDVLDHLFYACDAATYYTDKNMTSAKKNGTAIFMSIKIRIAALFHDVGKPTVKKVEQRPDLGTIYTFFNHEKESAKITNTVMNRLRFPKAITKLVCHLISEHMFYYESIWSDSAIRRFLVRIAPPVGVYTEMDRSKALKQILDDLFDLRIADVAGMTNTPCLMHKGSWSQNLIEFRERLDAELLNQNALTLHDLAISGKDLIKEGIPAGKSLGIILNELLKAVVEDPSINTKVVLIEMAHKLSGCDKIKN